MSNTSQGGATEGNAADDIFVVVRKKDETTLETVAPLEEVLDLIKETGGESNKFCYECGLCDTVCPWNRVRDFSMRCLSWVLY